MNAFQLVLTDEEKRFCKDLIRYVIAHHLGQAEGPKPALASETLNMELGAFVTLKRHDRLRGCIGNVVGNGPLVSTIERMAGAAAFEDPRFPPLGAEELDDLDIEVSVLGPITPCPDPELVSVGRHGLLLRRGGRSGLLLPQVPVEWGWDRETFLDQTCRKAGLETGCWRDPSVTLYWFEAEVF